MRAAPISALLLVLSICTAAAPLVAQRRELTLLVGGNLSGASGGRIAKSESRTGFQGGLSVRLPRSAMIYFQPEVLLVQRRFYAERTPSAQSAQLVGPFSDAPSMLYVQIPLLMRIQRGYSTERTVRPFLVLGPYVAVRVGCTREVVEADGSVTSTDCSVTPGNHQAGSNPFFPAVYQEVDVGLMGQAGVEVRRFSLGLRGEKSLRNLVDPGAIPTSPLDRARIWSASLSVEYLLRVL